MPEIALDAICDASARSNDEQFLSMLKNSATCSALQCGVFDKFRFSIIIYYNFASTLNLNPAGVVQLNEVNAAHRRQLTKRLGESRGRA